MIELLFKLEWTHLCKIQLMIEDATANNPPWGSTITHNIPIQLHALNGQDRLNRSAIYDINVSHEAFLTRTDDVKIGSHITLTHIYLENGDTTEITHNNDVYQVVGIIPIYGVPQPQGQLMLDLSQVNAQ